MGTRLLTAGGRTGGRKWAAEVGPRVLTAGGRTGGRKWVLEYSQRVDGPAGAISEMYRFASDDDTPTLK